MDAMPAKQGPGPLAHSDLALDVLARTAAFRARWPAIQNKTGIQVSDLEAWETAGARMLHALGEGALPKEDVTSASLNRHRAFTLFLRAYEEVRAALAFLRRKRGGAPDDSTLEEGTPDEGKGGAGGQLSAPKHDGTDSPFITAE